MSKNLDGFSEMFLPVYTMGVLALWRLRVSSWEDRALKGNAGHCNNSLRKCARKQVRAPNSECEHRYWRCDVTALTVPCSAMLSAGTVCGSANQGRGLYRPGSQE